MTLAPKPVPMPAPISGNAHKAAEPVRPAATSNGSPVGNQEKHMPRTLLEIGSYSGYKSMVDKIDRLVKDAFSAGKQMKVKIVCEEE